MNPTLWKIKATPPMKSNNSLYEQKSYKKKKKNSPPIKIGKTKHVLGKTVLGKI